MIFTWEFPQGHKITGKGQDGLTVATVNYEPNGSWSVRVSCNSLSVENHRPSRNSAMRWASAVSDMLPAIERKLSEFTVKFSANHG